MENEERNLIKLGDLTVDADTGEIVEQPEAFTIDTPPKLSWWLKKMRQLRALAASEKALAETAASRSRTLNNAAQHLEDRFATEAEPLVLSLLPHGRRSVLLEGGEAGFRRTAGSIDILDAITAIDWCKEHLPDAVKTTETLLKTPIADLVKTTGTLPPGVEQTPPTEKMWVR